MRVFKRGNTYFYEYEFSGKRYRKSIPCHNYSDVVRVVQSTTLDAHAAEYQHHSQPSCPTLTEFRDQFLARVVNEHRSIRTSQTYRQSFNKIAEYKPLADKPLNAITPVDVAEFMRFLISKQLSNATINRYVAFLNTVLRHAKDAGHVNILPSAPRKLRCERRFPYIIREDDYRKWLDYCPEPLKGMSILARNTGMRVGEMLALQKQDVTLLSEPDADGFWGTILVGREHLSRPLKVSRQVRDLLQSQMSRSKCQFVFTSLSDAAKALKRVTVYGQVKNVKSRGDFPTAGLHTFRATFLMELLHWADPFTVAKITGHSLRTTMHFTTSMKVNWQALRKLLTEESEEQ